MIKAILVMFAPSTFPRDRLFSPATEDRTASDNSGNEVITAMKINPTANSLILKNFESLTALSTTLFEDTATIARETTSLIACSRTSIDHGPIFYSHQTVFKSTRLWIAI